MTLTLLLVMALAARPAAAPSPLELRVVPDCRFCSLGEELSFHIFWRLSGAPIVVRRSALEVEDSRGTLLFTLEEAFCRPVGERLVAGNNTSNCASSALLKRLAMLPAGDYAVTWRRNDVSSNTARFCLGPTARPLVPLAIQPLVRHGETMAQPEPLAHFTNTGAESISLPALWGGSPGHCAVRAGRHQVRFVMGGAWSNEITIDIAQDDCRPTMRP